MQKSVPIYVKALRENDVDRVLIPDSNNPVASSVLAKEKTKLQTQIENIATSLNEYYLKTETYSKEEVNGLFEQLTGLGIEFKEVQTLPTTGENKYIYLVPKTGSTNDIYDEYIWVNGKFERIGSTAINLSNYYTKTETDAKLATKGGLSSANTWSGANNFTGNLTKNGANVATEGQIPKVDSTLSTTSTNAIQNKVVKTELDKKGGTSSANTWSANNNFTGGLQKNGVDVATVKDIENISGSGDVDENGYKKFYFVDKNFEVKYFGWNVTKFNEFIGLDADKVLPVGTFIIDNQFTVVKITGTQTNNGVKSYNWDFQNIANSDVIKFMPFVISADANGKYQFSDVYREEPVGIFLMDKNCVVYEIKARSEFDFLNGYTYTLTKYCEAIDGGGGNTSSASNQLQNGTTYPELIYFDTTKNIDDWLASLTYSQMSGYNVAPILLFNDNATEGIAALKFDYGESKPAYILKHIDFVAMANGETPTTIYLSANATDNPYSYESLYKQNNATYGWNLKKLYTGDLSNRTVTYVASGVDFILTSDNNPNFADVIYYANEAMTDRRGNRFAKTVTYCDTMKFAFEWLDGVVESPLFYPYQATLDWEGYKYANMSVFSSVNFSLDNTSSWVASYVIVDPTGVVSHEEETVVTVNDSKHYRHNIMIDFQGSDSFTGTAHLYLTVISKSSLAFASVDILIGYLNRASVEKFKYPCAGYVYINNEYKTPMCITGGTSLTSKCYYIDSALGEISFDISSAIITDVIREVD